MHYKILKYSSFLLVVFFFSGCSVWKNFTTYFNLYYNASTSFEEAEELIKEQKRDLFSTDPIVVPGTAGQLLNKVVEKTSVILQYHSETAFVDEALLMLGKSFYYQRNYQKGLRKFNELLATQQESEYILETQLWIAKTQMRLKSYSEALSLLEEVRSMALEEGEEEFVQEAYVEGIVYHIEQEDYTNAISLSNDFLNVSGNDEINAEVVFELGKLYRLIEDNENAIIAFKRVYEYAPSYEIDYQASIELGRVLRELDRTGAALDIFEDMRDEDKFRDYYDEIDLERGITLNELERYDEALEVLTEVDTGYTASASLNSGIARLKIGEIYQFNLMNYDSAAVYYQKAASSQAPPEYVMLSSSRNRLFTKYNNLSSTFRENRKQLDYAINPELFTRDSLDYVEKFTELKREEDVSYLFELPEEPDTARTNLDSLTMLSVLDSLGVLERFDSTYIATELDSLEMTTILDSIKFANLEEPGQQPGRDGEKGNQVMGGDTGFEGGTSVQEDTSALSRLVMPVKVNLPVDSLRNLLAKSKFDLGNMFFTELNVPDSAYMYYTDLLENHPGSGYEGQTLYALGSYYQTQSDTLKADSLFNVVYENFKNESVVNAAANKLNKPLINLRFDPAEELYIDAETQMMNEDFDSSLVQFYNIFEQYPESPFAPKALYAGGWILERELNLPDSAAAFYDSIAANYPFSEYASQILPKLNVYKQEQAMRQRSIEDSLAAIEKESIESDTTGRTLAPEVLPSDTAETFDQINRALDIDPVDTLRIDDTEPTIYGDPEYFETPELPVDSLLLQQEVITDSLQGRDRRGIDTLYPPPLDSLVPGNPGGEGDPP